MDTQNLPRDMALPVGIVVIGRNEGQRLVRCFEAIGSLQCQVVYVDSGSTDGSVAAAERFGAIVVQLNPARPFTAARARNEGVGALVAKAPELTFVQFIDGDCELDRDWLDRARSFLEAHEDVAAVCGRRRECYPENSLYNRLLDVEWDTPIGLADQCGGDSMMRLKAFQQVGGFRACLIADEEPELCFRLRQNNWKIWRIDAEMTRHDAAMLRFSQWWRRSVRSGYAILDVLMLRPLDMRLLKTISSGMFWGFALPLTAILSSLADPKALILLLAYPIQVFRISRRPKLFLSYATMMVLSKFAEAHGILKRAFTRQRAANSPLTANAWLK